MPSALTVSVIKVLHSGMLKGSTRQYHTFHDECMATAGSGLHTLKPTPCTLFSFDIGFVANQTVNSSGCRDENNSRPSISLCDRTLRPGESCACTCNN